MGLYNSRRNDYMLSSLNTINSASSYVLNELKCLNGSRCLPRRFAEKKNFITLPSIKRRLLCHPASSLAYRLGSLDSLYSKRIQFKQLPFECQAYKCTEMALL